MPNYFRSLLLCFLSLVLLTWGILVQRMNVKPNRPPKYFQLNTTYVTHPLEYMRRSEPSTGFAGAPDTKNKLFDPKIMIAIPTYNRIGYTQFHARVIREYHKIQPSDLYIFDDCSTEYGEKELREWYGKDIHYFACKTQLKSDANIRRMFEYFITTDFDLIFSIDTDLIFQMNWREFINTHINSTDGVMSLYHSNDYHHQTFNCGKEMCEKSSMGSAGTVMNKETVKKMLPQNKNVLFDWGFISVFKQNKIRMMVPHRSLIMHYGQFGQNNICGTTEIAKGFDRNILPAWIQDALKMYFDLCKKPNEILSFQE